MKLDSIVSAVSFVYAHKVEFLAAIAALVGAVSALLQALAGLLDLLVLVVPALKGADGKLHWAVNWIQALLKNPLLNGLALNPKAAAKALLLAFGLGLALHAAPARAEVLVSSGPTLPLMELRPGDLHPVSLAAGAGYQVSLTLPGLQKAIGGKAWDLLDLSLMAFGSDISSSSGATFGALSAAAGVCTLSSLLCVGGGHDIITSGSSGWFGLFAFSFNFGSSPSYAPAGAKGAAGLPRGNTLYFGAP